MSRYRLAPYVLTTAALAVVYNAGLALIPDGGPIRPWHVRHAQLGLLIDRRTDEAWRRRKEMTR